MGKFRGCAGLILVSSLGLFGGLSSAAWGRDSAYAPTSYEIVYQPTYSMATGGPTSQTGTVGVGIRIGYAMTKMIAFELGGYYDDFIFGSVAGTNLSMYAARGTADFALAPTQGTRFYLGIDANAFFNVPSSLTWTNNKDFGVIGGVRFLTPGPVKFFVGAEYRYAIATVFTYSGGWINSSALLGTVGIHFGGL